MSQGEEDGNKEVDQKTPREKGLFSLDIRQFSKIGNKEGSGDGKGPEQQADLKGPRTQIMGIYRKKGGYETRSHGGYENGHEQGDENFYWKRHG